MKPEQIQEVESEFSVKLPEDYKNAISQEYPFGRYEDKLESAYMSVRQFNIEFRKAAPRGLDWNENLWGIGSDGEEGVYFIDLRERDSRVYFYTPQASDLKPKKIGENEYSPFSDFIDHAEWEQSDKEVPEEPVRREWWQFWIPKAWRRS